jgi:type IV secretion system protein VirB5
MGFFKKKTLSVTGHENPYLSGREEWLERYGSYISRARQWKVMSFLTALALITSVAGNVIQARQVKVVPYIIEVDKLGKSAVIARADTASSTPKRVIQAAVAACIADWRTVTADVELQRKIIERLSFYMAGSAKGVLREWYEANNPYEIAKNKLVHVEIKGLPLPVSSDSYRVEWMETVRSHAGVLLDSHVYEATVTVQIHPPTTDAVLLRNPGGVYITALSAGKVVGAQPPAAPAKTDAR